MKKLLTILLASCTYCACEVNNKVTSDHGNDLTLIQFDSLLAKETGADPYGMRNYVIAYLKAGPNRDQDETTASQLQRAHMDNISRLAKEGKLVLAGPFLDDGEVRGIYVFAVDHLEEAIELTKSDPAIQAGRLTMELHPWYGSAALMKVNELHNRISREKI